MIRFGELLNVATGLPSVSKSFPGMSDRARAFDVFFDMNARRVGVPAALLKGIAAVESGFEPRAVNPSSGTAGLMQIHPIHFARLGWRAPSQVDARRRIGTGGSGWSDPADNIEAGTNILMDGYRAERNLARALARYNGASTWLRTGKQPEFEDYMRKVLAYANMFQG